MDDNRPTGELSHDLSSLVELDFSAHTLDATLSHVGRLALMELHGWDAAGTTLVERTTAITFGATDDVLTPVDQSQYDLEEGPCLDAFRTGSVHHFTSSASEQRWPRFEAAAHEAGIHSVLSFPLQRKDEFIGALNFYARSPDALQEGHRDTGLMFAAQAAVMLSNAKGYHSQAQMIQQLEDGLQTRTVIGQAVGLLMAQDGLTSDEAFQKLGTVSQNANIKLREIATRYVDAFEGKLRGPAEKSSSSS